MDLFPLQSGWSIPDLAANQSSRENLQDKLVFPDKAGQRAKPGSGWTPAAMNHILPAHVVDGALSTFGCVEWQSDLCRGIICARFYPFDMPKHHFHGMNQKVMYKH